MSEFATDKEKVKKKMMLTTRLKPYIMFLDSIYIISEFATDEEKVKKKMMLTTKLKPSIIFLDSIDQLNEDCSPFTMNWLPKLLKNGVKIVISTLPEDDYHILPNLKVCN